MSQPNKPPVPKFGTFKPKLVAKQTDVSQEGGDGIRSRHREHHRRSDHQNSDSHHRVRESDSSEGRSQRSGKGKDLLPVSTLDRDEFEESNLFIVDRRGDSKNVEFGSLHRYSVPVYHRIGSGGVLGARAGQKIDRDSNSGKAVALSSLDVPDARKSIRPLVDQGRTTKNGPRPLKLVVPAQSAAVDTDLDRDFVGLSVGRKGLKRKRDADRQDGESEEVDYRSIEGKATDPVQPEDEDLEFESESGVNDEEDALIVVARRKNADLSRRTKDDPGNAKAWLDLISHQYYMVSPASDRGIFTNGEKRTLADIRVSMYERALRHVTSNKDDVSSLWLGMMDEGAIIWETSKLVLKWNEALRQNPSSVVLWTMYLEFLQSNPISFNFTKCKEAYVKCLQVLGRENPSDKGANKDKPNARLDIFLRLSCYIRDAGYDELSYALWQVLLEYCFYRPSMDRDAELQALEEWWEADVPKIGEDGSLGWDHFYANGRSGSGSRPVEYPLPAPCDAPCSPLQAALQQEYRSADKLHLPATADDDELDDPYRHVMFSDIESIFQHMLGDHSPHLATNTFLCFMGLPPLPFNKEIYSSANANDDQFVCFGFPTGDVSTVDTSSNSIAERTTLWRQSWTVFDVFYTNHFPMLSQDAFRFVDRILTAITYRTPQDDTTAEYFLAFALHQYPAEATKIARRLLKARPTSLALYNAYACAEAQIGHLEKAVSVWKTALAGDIGRSRRDTERVLLWHSWVMVLLHHGNEDDALGVLVGIVSEANIGKTVNALKPEQVSPAQRLKVTRYLAESIEVTLSKHDYTHAVHYVDCLTWFTYLVLDGAIEAALPVFTKYVDILSPQPAASNPSTELLHQSKAKLIAHHVDNRRPYRPASIKLELNASLTLFPENSLFLSVLDMIRGYTTIDDRLRDTAKSAMSLNGRKEGPIACSHRIDEELRRFNMAATTSNSVRAVFSSVLLDGISSAKQSHALWSTWLNFELQQRSSGEQSGHKSVSKQASNDTSNERAKRVFYDGMRYLPWNKAWVIKGLSLLCEAGRFSDEEVRRVLQVTEERELRIRDPNLTSVTT